MAQDWIDVHAAVQHDLFGDRGSVWTLEEIRALVRGSDKKRVAVGAWLEGRLVGALEVHLPLRDNLHASMLWLSVHPQWRRRGVGSALLTEAERIVTSHGRPAGRISRRCEPSMWRLTVAMCCGMSPTGSPVTTVTDRPL